MWGKGTEPPNTNTHIHGGELIKKKDDSKGEFSDEILNNHIYTPLPHQTEDRN